MKPTQISVIVPIYGVRNYIRRCAHSLFNQTMTKGVEIIFVNDATKDDSIEILKEELHRNKDFKGTVKILNHRENRGLPAARNTGINAASGEYILHVDGDDFAEPTMIEDMYTAAVRNDADFVWCEYFITFSEKKRLLSQPSYDTPIDAVKGMLRGAMKYNVWNKLCRKSLYIDNNILFPEGHSMGEDITMIIVALNSHKCAHVKKPLYNYVQNPNQMTAVYNEEKLKSLLYNCERVWKYIEEKFPTSGLESEYASLCQLMKWPFLLDGSISSYKRWHKWFPESNRFIWKTKGVNFRIKFIEWSASMYLWPIVWFHYIIVIKMYYCLIYKK